MPAIRIPTPLRPYVDGLPLVSVNGASVRSALEDMLSRYPAFRIHIMKDDGTLRSYVNFFLEKQNIRDLEGLDTPLTESDVLALVPSIAGG